MNGAGRTYDPNCIRQGGACGCGGGTCGRHACTHCFDTGMLGAMSGYGTIWCRCAKGQRGQHEEAQLVAARAAWLAIQQLKSS